MASSCLKEETMPNDFSGDEFICDHIQCRKTVFVRSVPHSIRRKELTEFFTQFGPVSKVSIHTNCKTRKSKGTAQVQFLKLGDAENVLKLSDKKLKCRDRILKPIPSRCQRVWKHKSTEQESNTPASNVEINLSDVQESECYINTLPCELLNYIFSFLDFKERIRIEKVCKLWRHLSSTIPWANMKTLVLEDKYFPMRQKLNSSILEAILRRCGSTLRSLDLSMCNHQSLSHKFPIIIANHCPNLEEINLHGRKISCKAIGILAESCLKLKIVDLSKSSVGDKWLSKLLKHCKVSQLNLCYVSKITGKNFQLISDNMRVLNLNYCRNLLPDCLNFVSKHRNIRQLHLNSCSTLSLNSVQEMFNSLGPLLTILDIGGYFAELNGLILSEGLAKCHNLEELFLESNSYIDDAAVRVISTNCLRLRTLNISSCYVSDESLKCLSNLDSLRNLFVNYIERITEGGLRELSLKGILENIELRGCSSVSNDGCSGLVSNCRQLKLLDISSCPHVTDVAFSEIESANRMDMIQLIIYAGGTGITQFFNKQTVQICDINKCPRERRPWNMDYYYDDSDDDWDDDLDFDHPDFDYDYDDYDVDDWIPDMFDLDYGYDAEDLYLNEMDDWS